MDWLVEKCIAALGLSLPTTLHSISALPYVAFLYCNAIISLCIIMYCIAPRPGQLDPRQGLGDKTGCLPTLVGASGWPCVSPLRRTCVTNSEIYQQVGQVPVSEIVLSSRLELFSHVARCGAEQRRLRAMSVDPPRSYWRRPVFCLRQTLLRWVMPTADLLHLTAWSNTVWKREQNRDRWPHDMETATLRTPLMMVL